jgi:hypothetical protein
MSVHEEVEEHVHHAQDPFDKIVAGTMAIMAALLAIISVLGQHFNTEELLLQGKASDEWAYYQAKDIRRFTAEATRDLTSALKPGTPVAGSYNQLATRYKNDAQNVQTEARAFEHERDEKAREATRFHFSEVFVEVAIVFASLAILTKVRPLFLAGIVAAAAGIIIAATAWVF